MHEERDAPALAAVNLTRSPHVRAPSRTQLRAAATRPTATLCCPSSPPTSAPDPTQPLVPCQLTLRRAAAAAQVPAAADLWSCGARRSCGRCSGRSWSSCAWWGTAPLAPSTWWSGTASMWRSRYWSPKVGGNRCLVQASPLQTAAGLHKWGLILPLFAAPICAQTQPCPPFMSAVCFFLLRGHQPRGAGVAGSGDARPAGRGNGDEPHAPPQVRGGGTSLSC